MTDTADLMDPPVPWWPAVPLAYLVLVPWRHVGSFLAGAVIGALVLGALAGSGQAPSGTSAADTADTFPVSAARTTAGPVSEVAASPRDDPVPRGSPNPQPSSASAASPSRAELEAIVRSAFPDEPERAVRVVECESTFRPDAIGDDGRAVGLWQWWYETWTASARRALGYDPGDRRTDPLLSTAVAAHKVATEGWWAWSRCHTGVETG